ncbi:MAG TPA: malate synthase G, partial [Sphingomicrobium sp.]|nr:malate synthase G [Sphingomicrobium sp.]
MTRVQTNGLQVATVLHDFLEREALAGTGVSADAFWSGLAGLVRSFAPRDRELLAIRDKIQGQIDDYHRARKGQAFDQAHYEQFLRDIGYVLPEPEDFSVKTQNVDDEIARIAGPQLVVPVSNARYALNAANARWGSLYDALYGTDVLPESDGAERGKGYNPVRGAKVIEYARRVLDEAAPLAEGSHSDATGYSVASGRLLVEVEGGRKIQLENPGQFVGYNGSTEAPTSILLKNNNLHLEIVVDRSIPIGASDKAGISDVLVEAAITTIQDCEDSVATVDAEDKVLAYRNWLGLMRGDLAASFEKGGRTVTRRLAADRSYRQPNGGTVTLKGRSLLLVRNVGHLMT